MKSKALKNHQLMGIGISPGYAQGKAFQYQDILDQQDGDTPAAAQQNWDLEIQYARVTKAFADVLADLALLTQHVEQHMGQDYADILRASKTVLRDGSLLRSIREAMAERRLTAEAAVKTVLLQHRDRLYALDNSFFRDRGDDIGDLCKRLLRALAGKQHLLEQLPADAILITKRLMPSDTLLLQRKSVAAIVVEYCGTNAHAAIFAREIGIPLVSGINNVMNLIPHDTPLLVDAISGRLLLNPDDRQRERFVQRRRQYTHHMETARKNCRQPAITMDGAQIAVTANVGNAEEIQLAADNGADGIGLYRLEQLYARMIASPDVDTLVRQLRGELEPFQGKPITIRLLDSGGDKPLPYLEYPVETNPVLGQRGIRYLFDHSELLVIQLRALLELSRDFIIKILVPMVTLKDDMEAVLRMLQHEASDMNLTHLPPLGAMIETPAAALCAREIASVCDFVSIGSNDLAQYTMAAERESQVISRYYQDDHPAVLSLLEQVCRQVDSRSISICGELAGNEAVIPALLTMGIRQLSVLPLRVPMVKETVRVQTIKAERLMPA